MNNLARLGKVAGVALLLVSLYFSAKRYSEAKEEDKDRVVAQESGAFIGGIAGSLLGGFLMTLLLSNPVGWGATALIFGASLLIRYFGAKYGAEGGDKLYDSPIFNDDGLHFSF